MKKDRTEQLYVDVILPLALPRLYTYKLPDDFSIQVQRGARVIVPFGKSKMYTAIIYKVHFRKPEHYEAKTVLEVLDAFPIISEKNLELWNWISEYYLCTLGEVMIAALPGELKLQSETMIVVHPSFNEEDVLLTEDEVRVIQMISEKKKPVSISDAVKYTGTRNGLRMIREMIERDILQLSEEIRDAFQPRSIFYVDFTPKAKNEEFLSEVFGQIEKRAPKQLEMLMAFIKLHQEAGEKPVLRDRLLKTAGGNSAILKQLVKRDVLELIESKEDLNDVVQPQREQQISLSEVQQQAFERISERSGNPKITLLHGVTSSGKTEVYIRLISDQIATGKQVLYLLPEIALTTQIIGRLRRHFGEQMLVFHSRFSPRERAEVFMKVANDGIDGTFRYPIIIGARSAVFLPLKNPGLIIVDEEHDYSYKQQDPAPRYHARDLSVVCGTLYGCDVLLGSATPCLESYHNAETGKYELVRMNERFGGLKMPEIKLVDLKEAYRKKQVKANFTHVLLESMRSTLASNQQVILFQNRRGFATVIECKKCGWIPRCVNCDVTLTYHKRSNHLRCHYCGYTTSTPAKCNACGDPDVRMKGMGTERVEDEVSIFFPDHRVERLDLDTGSSRSGYLRIISGFESGDIDILVGTQMVTKGLDFDNVGLVGVINADGLMNFPDFRSVERSYQLLAQVAGRSGRKFRRGQVLVQTFQISHPMLQFLIRNDYEGWYRFEINERQKYLYPPFYRLIQISLKHRDEKTLELLSRDFNKILKEIFGKRVLGPVTPPVGRIRNLYIRHILLKLEKGLPNHDVKQKLQRVTDRFLSIPENRSLKIQMDVDPY
jgi:primosomal protein N' (replication factor Y) (superfamily II helicase)